MKHYELMRSPGENSENRWAGYAFIISTKFTCSCTACVHTHSDTHKHNIEQLLISCLTTGQHWLCVHNSSVGENRQWQCYDIGLRFRLRVERAGVKAVKKNMHHWTLNTKGISDPVYWKELPPNWVVGVFRSPRGKELWCTHTHTRTHPESGMWNLRWQRRPLRVVSLLPLVISVHSGICCGVH